MVADFVEAVEDLPIGAIHRACKSWNQRAFKWPNYSFPPTPPDMRRAVDETITEMKVERYDLDAVLKALPAPKPPRPTQEERERAAAEAADVIASILRSSEISPPEPGAAPPSAERMQVAAELEARQARREAAEREGAAQEQAS